MSVDKVTLPREQLQAAYNYILHCGSNATARGEPHPQQQIVDWLEAALEPIPDDEAVTWAEEVMNFYHEEVEDPATFAVALNILRRAKKD